MGEQIDMMLTWIECPSFIPDSALCLEGSDQFCVVHGHESSDSLRCHACVSHPHLAAANVNAVAESCVLSFILLPSSTYVKHELKASGLHRLE